MRVVFVGSVDPAIHAAKVLIDKGCEVILVEEDEKKIEQLRAILDCGLVLGDGSNPDVLLETNPKTVDFLFALTSSDQENILIGLLGRSLGFKSVVVSIHNVSYEKMCLELGLENTIIPSLTIGNFLIKFVEHEDVPDLKDYIKDEARLFKVIVNGKDPETLAGFNFPPTAKPICLYRSGKFYLISEQTHFKENDEIVILTERNEIPNLEKLFSREK